MQIHAEVTGAILRFRSDPNAQPTDPYDFVLFVVGDFGRAILKGLKVEGPFRMHHEQRAALALVLLGLGFHTAEWTRMRAGKPHVFTVDLSKILKGQTMNTIKGMAPVRDAATHDSGKVTIGAGWGKRIDAPKSPPKIRA